MNYRDRERLKQLIQMAAMHGSDFLGKKMSDMGQRGPFRDPDIIDMPQEDELYKKNPGRKALGITFTAVGCGVGGMIFLADLVMLGFLAMMGEATAGLILSSITLPFLGGFGYMAWKGIKMIGRANRFRSYVQTLGQEEMCNIKKLAQSVGKKEKFVVRDVEKMIREGWFLQGHLDDKKTCLMVTDHMYREYRKIEAERARHLLEEEERRKRVQAEAENKRQEEELRRKASDEARRGLSPELRKVIEQGDTYVRKIRQCNDAIPGEVVSAKIDRMEILVDRIFDRVEQKPETVGEIRKLMEYYLPTTVKLLETYAEMDAQPVGGENIRAAKKEIEDTLDTINAAFEKLLDSLFQNDAWDISSDISVLNTMLAQEGLKDDGLKNRSAGTDKR